jgi:hypothetical protein
MIDMINQHVIPSAKKAGFSPDELIGGVKMLKAGLAAVHAEHDEFKQAEVARTLRLEVGTNQSGNNSSAHPDPDPHTRT